MTIERETFEEDIESIFSDASDSDGSFFSDGGSSCDDSEPENPPEEVPIIAVKVNETATEVKRQSTIVVTETIKIGDHIKGLSPIRPCTPRKSADEANLVSSSVSSKSLKPRSKSFGDGGRRSSPCRPEVRETRALTNVTNVRSDDATKGDILRHRKATTTPIRKKIQSLQHKQSEKTYSRTHILMDLQIRRKALMDKCRPTELSSQSSIEDTGNTANVFEMTMAEEEREDQKKRHRMFREKFEQIAN